METFQLTKRHLRDIRMSAEELRQVRRKKHLYQVWPGGSVDTFAEDSRPEKGMPASGVATKLPRKVSW